MQFVFNDSFRAVPTFRGFGIGLIFEFQFAISKSSSIVAYEIVGRGWVYGTFQDGFPNKSILDRIVPNKLAFWSKRIRKKATPMAWHAFQILRATKKSKACTLEISTCIRSENGFLGFNSG
jgi:hypothetical protein